MSDHRSYLFRCPDCLTKNRIPADKVGIGARCGKCGMGLNTKDLFLVQPILVTDGNFEQMVIKSPLPVLLECWAGWCSACALISPVIETLSRDWKGRIRVGKLNVEANPLLTARYDLRSLPTLLVFDGGRLRDTLFGALPKHHIAQRMTAFL